MVNRVERAVPLLTYLINLDRATERLERMRQQLLAADIDFVRISAIDGRSLSSAEVKQYLTKEGSWGWLTPGEIGCFLSHRLCWQAIADGTYEYGVILEDDVVLGDDAGKILSDLSWLPRGADIVKIETAESRIFVDRVVDASICGRSLMRLRSAHYCTGGYILSKSAAHRLVRQHWQFCEAVDDALFSQQAVAANVYRMHQLVPALCVQQSCITSDYSGDPLHSSIEGREDKAKRQLGVLEWLKQIAFKESQSAINKLLCLVGQRERMIVAFK